MAIGKQIGQFEGHPTSVSRDYVGNDLRYASNMEGKVSGLPGEGTFAWTQVALATGLAALLSLCALACSSGSGPGQPQAPAAPKDAAAQPQAPEGQRRPLPNRLRRGMRISLRSSKRRGKAIWMKWPSDASCACWCRSGGQSSSTWKGVRQGSSRKRSRSSKRF